jgi:hypothetical protein
MGSAIEIRGTKNNVPEHARIDWLYPEIYDRDKQSTLRIGMCHTRAADDIRIKYDSERDGWVIEQSSTFAWDCEDPVMDEDWQEAAFVQAWAREKEQED